MWKCLRCEKENQDCEEKCADCGQGRTMAYTSHRTLSKVSESIVENWRIPTDTSEYFIKQGREHLHKVIECLVKTNAVKPGETGIWGMTLAELNKYFETDGAGSQKEDSAGPKKEKTVLMADNDDLKYVFGSGIRREDINKIKFVKVNRNQVPRYAWDISIDKNGTIWAWIQDSGRSLKIGAENKIYANPDSSRLFENYIELKEIEFNSMFDTTRVTDMSNMFAFCKNLTELDMTGFDTACVTNMSCMFYACENLTKLDITGFDTTYVKDMSYMFFNCKDLTRLDGSENLRFNANHSADRRYMFFGCEDFVKLDVSGKKIYNGQETGRF